MFYRKNLIAMVVVILGLVVFIPVTQAEEKMIPIRDFKEIAGKWEGKLDGPGWSTKITLIFNNDGTGDSFVPQDSSIFMYSEKGRFPIERKLVDGKIRTKNLLSGGTGTTTLHEEGGKRFLKSQTDDGAQSGVYEQVK